MTFKNKTLIITGAAQGIGFEIARQLAEQGANIVLNDIDPELGNEAVNKLNKISKAHFIAGDAGDLDHIKTLIGKAVSAFGEVNYAIANAGITTFGSFLDYSPEKLEKLLHVNIHGTFFLAQQAAKQMIAQNKGGRILMVSSTTGLRSHPELEAYGMTKAGIAFLASTLGVQLAGQGITVNCITPGATATERTTDVAGWEGGWAELIPTKRVAKALDIASTALFLLSETSGQITGQNIVVDGGWSNSGPMPQAI